MHIHGASQIHGAQAINSPHKTNAPQPTGESRSAAPTDQLEISPQADLVSRVREAPEIRADRVADIRAAIANGTYETHEKLNVALDRLLDEIS